jgi:hyaluronoglucosaminidase
MKKHWLPLPKQWKATGDSLPFAGCHAVKCPQGWEMAIQPLTEMGEAYGGWTAFFEHDSNLPLEGYRLQVENARIKVYAGSPRAAFYACQTLLQAWNGQSLPLLEVEDSPALAWRGVVEGFYGIPWTHKARLGMLDFMGQIKMNLYLYAPKDDPYHREKWREPYPEEDATRLQELIEQAKTNFVEFGFCISPGLSMVYSDAHEFRKLTAKIDAVMQMGVHIFGLLVDDIPEELQHETDQATYHSLAHAHADLANRLHTWLLERNPDAWLIICPTFYHNTGEPPYIKELGERTREGISIMWTGKKVVSRTIPVEDAQKFAAAIRRKPFVWDNYPVNDYETNRLLLAPITGRPPEVLNELEAVLSNPMNQAEASKIGVGTFADYLWNARDYEPDRSWNVAIRQLVGEDALQSFKTFCKENLWTRHWTNDPPGVAKTIEEWQTTGDPESLQTELGRLKALPPLVRARVKNVVLLEEIEPWLERMEQVSSLALNLLEQIEANEPDHSLFKRAREALKENEAIVSNGWVVRWINDMLAEG